ncbi:MAG: hypothetical protein MK135_13155 [Polyangiaceae bacterium]|nr:hypothetical protein [Polyangiaceae bacterium]
MLQRFKIENLGLIRSAELNLSHGLHALTGESGAGKSTIFGALGLLQGLPRPRLRPRPGQKTGFAEAEFQLNPQHHQTIIQRLAQEGIHLGSLDDSSPRAIAEEMKSSSITSSQSEVIHPSKQARETAKKLALDSLVIARRVEVSGRTRSYIQGQVVSRNLLAEIAALLFELTGQDSAQGLRSPAQQLVALDKYAGLEKERVQFEGSYKQALRLAQEVEELEKSANDSALRRDYLEYQFKELNEIDLNELTDLLENESSLAQEEKLRAAASEVETLLGGRQSPLHRIESVLHRAIATEHQTLESLADHLAVGLEALQAAQLKAEQIFRDLESGREERELAGRQISQAKELALKHRCDVEDLHKRKKEIETELKGTDKIELDLAGRKKELAERNAELLVLAQELHQARLAATTRLEVRAKEELARVDLEGALLEFHLAVGPLGPSGHTHLELGFSSHSAAPAQPLGRIASGGELSRILLSLRLSMESEGTTLLFDEIDAGTGGKTAELIGRALSRAARQNQILCITHWPQVAALANDHFLVEKVVSKKSQDGDDCPEGQLQRLSKRARESELARMLGGRNASALAHAKTLIHSLESESPSAAKRQEGRIRRVHAA